MAFQTRNGSSRGTGLGHRPIAIVAMQLPQRCNRGRSERIRSLSRDTSVPQAASRPPALASLDVEEVNVVTRFIAETLLPTKHGKFRLRGYKHSVSTGMPWPG